VLWLSRVPPSGAGQSARATARVTSPANTRDIWRRRTSAEPECLLPSEQLCFCFHWHSRARYRPCGPLPNCTAATLNSFSPQWWVLSAPPGAARRPTGRRRSPLTLPRGRCPRPKLLIFEHPPLLSFFDWKAAFRFLGFDFFWASWENGTRNFGFVVVFVIYRRSRLVE